MHTHNAHTQCTHTVPAQGRGERAPGGISVTRYTAHNLLLQKTVKVEGEMGVCLNIYMCVR